MKISASNEFWILEVFITRWVRSLFFFHFCLTVKLWKSFNGYKTLPNFSNSMGVQPNRQSKCQLRTLLLDTFKPNVS